MNKIPLFFDRPSRAKSRQNAKTKLVAIKQCSPNLSVTTGVVSHERISVNITSILHFYHE